MTLDEVMDTLKEMGREQTKQTFFRHGAKEPFFGVRVGDMKKLVKQVKKDQELVLALFETGNSDAMYLAGLSADPKKISKKTLQEWGEKAYWYMLAEYTVDGVAAESPFALELAREWMESDEDMIATCGWSTFSNYLSITPDEDLDLDEIHNLLQQVEKTVHHEKNRVRYAMNNFVICTGAYVGALHKEAASVAEKIGKVHVDVGQTACKVPLATQYIQKIANRNKIGAKRKTCIC